MSFMANYKQNPRIDFEIKKKKKYMKAEEFIKEIKKTQEKAQTALTKVQEEMK